MNNYFEELESKLSNIEIILRHNGLPEDCTVNELENLIGSLETLLETANELFDKVG